MYLYKTTFDRDICVGGVSDNNRLIIDDNLLCANDIFENILYASKGLYVYMFILLCSLRQWCTQNGIFSNLMYHSWVELLPKMKNVPLLKTMG